MHGRRLVDDDLATRHSVSQAIPLEAAAFRACYLTARRSLAHRVLAMRYLML